VVRTVPMEGSARWMIDVKLKDGWYIVTLPKSVLVLTKAGFIQALRWGKWWKRRAANEARPSPTPRR
jgi:hypothetical protein